MMDTFSVISSTGRTFRVRLVRPGDQYGRDLVLTHSGDPMVEFYDREQLVSRYYVSTFMESVSKGHGLCLDAGVDAWSLDYVALEMSSRWVKQQLPQ